MTEGRHCPVVAPRHAAEAVMDLREVAVDADPDLGKTGFLERGGHLPVYEPAVAVHGDAEAEAAGERGQFQKVVAQERFPAAEVDGKDAGFRHLCQGGGKHFPCQFLVAVLPAVTVAAGEVAAVVDRPVDGQGSLQ